MIVKQVQVSQIVKVTVDETKFTSGFMEEFRQSFYRFYTLDDHIEHLAQLYARGVVSGFPGEFIEGYGPADDMGIRFEQVRDTTEIEIVT